MATSIPHTAGPALASPQGRSQGIALRRGLTLVGMTLLIPGSAQVAAGNKALGRFALRVWLILLGALVLFGLLLFFFRSAAIGLYANPVTLTILRWAVLILGVGWLLLVLDAWRLANPRAMSTSGRLVSGGLAVALSVLMATSSWAAAGMFAAQSKLVTNVFTGGGTTEIKQGRYNVLLLGGDAGDDRVGLRPDSMTVASIDAETGRTVLFSLPRNLQWAPFPEDSPLHKKYPNGYWCASQECLLNAVFTLGQSNKKLYPGVKYPGVQATKEVIEEILGLEINYWAMIDLKGFEALIDAVGGIRLDIAKRVPIGSLHGPKGVYDWIEPGKNVKLDGFHALWFARSREYSNDYERMIRQKCVMNAMVKQLNPTTVLTKFNAIAEAGEQVVATDVPTSEIGTLLDLAIKGKSLPLASVSFAPPLIKPVKPDFPFIRDVVAEKIAASEELDAAPPAGAGESAAPDGEASGSASPKPSPTKSKSKVEVDDLDSVCSVSKS